ncbi:hypothetical protein AB0N77_09840 [Streptomyces misionensis]|uniref:hypothetical protein n=1 Tax=Streptomyces misionensis TaxID=67331 RepID=UPI003426F95A
MVFRIEPQMGPEAYKTYAIVSPISTHMRRATCEEVGCEHYLNGWRVRVEALTPDLVRAARNSGRKYTEQSIAQGETWLVFDPGQPCFKAHEHRAPIGRPPLYLVRDGDHRGNPRGTQTRRYDRPDQWVDDFATHQDTLADEIRKG